MKSTCCCLEKKYCRVNGAIICLNSKCESYLSNTHISYTPSFTFAIYSLLVFSMIFFPYNKGKSDNTGNIPLIYLKKSEMPVPDLNMYNVSLEVKKNGILCPGEVCAQIKLESANLNSFLTKRTNNMLGMRYPYKRKTTAVGIYLPEKDSVVYGNQKALLKYKNVLSYAVYSSWVDAIRDYKLWQDQSFNVTKRYLDFLGKNYAEDSSYINKIKNISSKS